MKTTTNKSSAFTQIPFSAVAIVLGYLLLFKPSIQVSTLCQILCGSLVAVGVVSIVSFFVSGDFKRIDRYGFAVGTMLIILGCIGLLRNSELTAHFDMYTGFAQETDTASNLPPAETPQLVFEPSEGHHMDFQP